MTTSAWISSAFKRCTLTRCGGWMIAGKRSPYCGQRWSLHRVSVLSLHALFTCTKRCTRRTFIHFDVRALTFFKAFSFANWKIVHCREMLMETILIMQVSFCSMNSLKAPAQWLFVISLCCGANILDLYKLIQKSTSLNFHIFFNSIIMNLKLKLKHARDATSSETPGSEGRLASRCFSTTLLLPDQPPSFCVHF